MSSSTVCQSHEIVEGSGHLVDLCPDDVTAISGKDGSLRGWNENMKTLAGHTRSIEEWNSLVAKLRGEGILNSLGIPGKYVRGNQISFQIEDILEVMRGGTIPRDTLNPPPVPTRPPVAPTRPPVDPVPSSARPSAPAPRVADPGVPAPAEAIGRPSVVIAKGQGIWHAAHKMLEDGTIDKDQFNFAWKTSQIDTRDGSKIHVYDAGVHPGDKVVYNPATRQFELISKKDGLYTYRHEKSAQIAEAGGTAKYKAKLAQAGTGPVSGDTIPGTMDDGESGGGNVDGPSGEVSKATFEELRDRIKEEVARKKPDDVIMGSWGLSALKEGMASEELSLGDKRELLEALIGDPSKRSGFFYYSLIGSSYGLALETSTPHEIVVELVDTAAAAIERGVESDAPLSKVTMYSRIGYRLSSFEALHGVGTPERNELNDLRYSLLRRAVDGVDSASIGERPERLALGILETINSIMGFGNRDHIAEDLETLAGRQVSALRGAPEELFTSGNKEDLIKRIEEGLLALRRVMGWKK